MRQFTMRMALAALLLSGLLAACGGEPEATATATPATTVAEAAPQDPTRPPPVISANATATGAAPTDANAPTAAPGGDAGAPPTPTAQPTAVITPAPTPTPTATAVPPTAVPPTAVPPTAAPPTAVPPTAVPPTAVPPTAPPPLGARGLTASSFALQDRANLTVNGKIWFEFHVANSTSGDVAFEALGVMPRKDGVDRPEWFQRSWGGNNDVIGTGGLSWEDHIDLPEAGNYTLRLVVCFDPLDSCKANPGLFASLSPEIPITVR